MRALSYQGDKSTPKDNEVAHLRTLLSKGTECGLIFGYKSGGKNFYFLNSDLIISPKPIFGNDEGSGAVHLDVSMDERVGEIFGDTALLPSTRAASSSQTPIPQIESEKKLILWLSWLLTPIRRDILHAISEAGKISRPELRRRLGFWADRLAVYEGVATGILTLDSEKNVSFQFSNIDISQSRSVESALKWICLPPSFMLSRSYTPLTSIQGGNAQIENLKRGRISPMSGLKELESKGFEVIPEKRPRTIGSNFLQIARIYGMFDKLPKFRNTNSSILRPVPDKFSLNNGDIPLIWINDVRMELPTREMRMPTTGGKLISIKDPAVINQIAAGAALQRNANEHIHKHLASVERRLAGIQSRSLSSPVARDLDSQSNRQDMNESSTHRTIPKDFHDQ